MGKAFAILSAVAALATSTPSFGASPGESMPGKGAAGDVARSYFTDLVLVDQNGRELRFYSDVLEGRVVIISGFYVNCTTISPRQNLVLFQLQRALGDRLGRDALLVSVTVDPKRDDPVKVKEYASAFRPGPGWLFLTGKPENVDWVNYRLGQYTEDVESHRGIYLVGNVKTGLWMKMPPLSTAAELRRAFERAYDDGESSR